MGRPEDAASRTQRTYDALGGRYDTLTRALDNTVLNRLRRDLLAHGRGAVLEVAIGTGKNIRFYPDSCELSGIDLSSAMLEVARKRAVSAGRALAIHRGDATALPFEAERFDTVVCTLSGCTFDDPLAVFREMRRVCRRDGQALWLEHVRPRSRTAQLVFGAIAPAARAVLGCDPTRDTRATVEAAGWTIEDVQSAVRGVLLAIRARRA